MPVHSHLSVAEYFFDALTSAMRHQGVVTTSLTQAYLVHLLSTYATTTLDDEPVALRLAQAATAPPEERARHLREVGDTSLYLSGFFADSLSRSLVDVNYYIDVGGAAYLQLAHMPSRGTPCDVFFELSGNFARLVEVLGEVSDSSLGGPLNVVQLYERWLRTGSERDARRLRALGIKPPGGESH